jgi:putative transposase
LCFLDSVSKYSWSSFNDYLGRPGICDVKFGLSLFSENDKKAKELFEKFNDNKNDDQCLEYEEKNRIDDREATKIIMEEAGAENARQIQNYEKERRDKVIKRLKNKGLSIRQIERLTGVSFGIIRKI